MGSLTAQSKTNSVETELTYWHVGKFQISSSNNTTTKTAFRHNGLYSNPAFTDTTLFSLPQSCANCRHCATFK